MNKFAESKPINFFIFNFAKEKLLNGESFVTSEKGNSMTPLIYSGQEHRIAPVKIEDVVKGDICYVKIRSRFVTHLVLAVDKQKGCLIGNNHGLVNGWTKNVYGKVIEVLDKK